jgi:hypothetical protein
MCKLAFMQIEILKSLSRQSFIEKNSKMQLTYLSLLNGTKKGAKSPFTVVIKYIKKYFKNVCF